MTEFLFARLTDYTFDPIAPTTTLGDLIYRNSTTNARLPIGSTSDVLQVVAGVPAWGKVGLASLSTGIGFRADRNGVDQTGIVDSTATVAQMNHEVFDQGNYYDNTTYIWTPPAGTVMLTAKVALQGTITVGALAILYIYKNGSILSDGLLFEPVTNNDMFPQVTIIDNANGTDAYQVKVYLDVASGSATMNGNLINSYFAGAVLH